MDQSSFVYTKGENCKGCNKCIYVCATHANEAFFREDEGKVFIKDGYCISCGECLNICDHNARDYYDDLRRFFSDLRRGKKISVVIAPALSFNTKEVKKVVGLLKQLGVNQVYDVSFGADICTWAHIKAIKEEKIKNIITQPCPVVVSYVEKYLPELINRLSPVHSPVMCAATYLKKYLGITDEIMFLSPCVGKKRECLSENTHGAIEYNVTFQKFFTYLKEKKISLSSAPEAEFDNIQGALGFVFPRPGGLAENIKYYMDEDLWITQLEGIKKISEYFTEYKQDLELGNPVPDIVDLLNCEDGCNFGTGTTKEAKKNEIDYKLNTRKRMLKKETSDSLFKLFDEKLVFDDFIRKYMDRSINYHKDEDVNIEEAFISLGKFTEADRHINCFSCGYGNCYDFAYDLALGHNNKNNCKYYLLGKFKTISLLDNLTGVRNRHGYEAQIVDLTEKHPGCVGILYVDINGLKEANDKLGHNHGDYLIIRCATVLKDIFKNDVYRLGGDEFLVLESCATEFKFYEKLANVRELFAQEEILSVSIGSAISCSKDDLDKMLEIADQKMYAEKQKYYNTHKKRPRIEP